MITSKTISKAKRGVHSAQKTLYTQCAPRLFTLCRRYARDNAEAKDYLQEAFIRIFERLDSFKSDPEKLMPWMYSVTRNLIINKIRDRRLKFSELPLEHLPEGLIIEYSAEHAHQAAENLLSLLQKLPIKYRTIINLYYIEGLDHQEIADILNIKKSSSRSKLSRSLDKLKELIAEAQKNRNYERQII